MTALASAPATRTVDFDGPYLLSIDGELATADTSFDVVNPATGKVLASAPEGTVAHIDSAVAAARRAFPAWSALPWEERQAYISRYADALDAHREELARLLTLEQGKPLHTMATSEVDAAIFWVREVAKRSIPVEVIEDTDEHVVEVHHPPLGVVGAITPWNFPVLLGLWKIAPALLTGNTMVMKISFTGSTATGKKVMASASTNLKRVTLELGGNDAAIILPGTDVQAIVPTLFWACFGNSGQWCIAVKRVYIHSSIYREFVDAFVEYAKDKTVGNGIEPTTDLGPIQNSMQYGKLLDMFADIRANGYTVLLGGEIDESLPGNYVPVTVVDNPPDDSRIVREEPFGPVVPMLSFETVDEVVRRANDTDFGLGGSVWGPPEQAAEVALRLETGTVWVNEIHVHGIDIPFGGHKLSGMGVENGAEGLQEFTNTKTLMFKK